MNKSPVEEYKEYEEWKQEYIAEQKKKDVLSMLLLDDHYYELWMGEQNGKKKKDIE